MSVAVADQLIAKIILPGEPRGKGRPRFRVVPAAAGRPAFGQAYTDAATRHYEDKLKQVAALAMRGCMPFDGAVMVRVIARMPVPQSWPAKKQRDAHAGIVRPTGKPDADNLLKVIDSCNGVVWNDDSQVVSAFVSKVYSAAPALVIEVYRIAPPPPLPATLFQNAGSAA